jgi:hypothetical protein
MFNVFDLLIVISLCVIVIFCLHYLKCSKKVKIEEKNIDINQENDILQIFYDESSYKIEVGGIKNKESENAGVHVQEMELGITSIVDDGDNSGNEDESGGFFAYRPNDNDEFDEDENDEENIPDPPKTWADFMGEGDAREELSPEALSSHFRKRSIKDVVARVREDILEKPLSDEDFRKKYFSRLYDDGNNKNGKS